MAYANMSIEEEPHPKNPLNNKEGNLRDGEIEVDLNYIKDNKYELKRTIKTLRSELRKVKEDNERILNALEKLNSIMFAKIHNDEKEKIRNLKKIYLKLHLINVRTESWNFLSINLKHPVKS